MTLVELLMAATVASILLLGVGLHLRGAITAWRRATRVVDDLHAAAAALDQLTQDLANAIVIDARPSAQPQPAFAADALQCYTLPLQAAAVQWVGYAMEGGRLMRSAQPIQSARAGAAPETEPLLDGLEGFVLQYGYLRQQGSQDVVWRPSWDDAAHLPRLVDVTITFRPGATQPSLHQVVVIPTGVLKTPETS